MKNRTAEEILIKHRKSINLNEDSVIRIADAIEAMGEYRNQGMPTDEDLMEPIQDALYATGRFTTDQCDQLADGILIYIKESNWFKSQIQSK